MVGGWNWKCQWPNGKVRLQTKLEEDSNLLGIFNRIFFFSALPLSYLLFIYSFFIMVLSYLFFD